jgi:hypothetical protein
MESELREGGVVTCDHDGRHLYDSIGFRSVSVHLLAELRPKQDGKLRWAPAQCLYRVPTAEALLPSNDRAEERAGFSPVKPDGNEGVCPALALTGQAIQSVLFDDAHHKHL